MNVKKLTLIAVLAGFICLLFSVSQADRQEVDFSNQVRGVAFSKAVPGLLNYQGYLADASDSSAVTAVLEMTFRLFDTETKGAELWSEIHPTVEVDNGLFQVLLGSMTSFPADLFDGNTLWLQTEIGPEVLSPRKPLVSTAYSQKSGDSDHATTADHAATAAWATDAQHAIYADTADYTLSGGGWTVDGDNVYRMTGKVGIGTASPLTELDVSGSVNATTYYGDGSNLTGVSGTSDGDWTISGADMFSNVPGNVGIGTGSPTKLLDVNGVVRADSLSLGSSAKAGIDGALHLYRVGSADPIVHVGTHLNHGGKILLTDDLGSVHTYLEPDVSGAGGYLEVLRSSTEEGFYVDGNLGGSEEPVVGIQGSTRGAYFQMNQPGDASVVLPVDAVSAGEIKDEPGVASNTALGPVTLTGSVETLLSRSITVPDSGYVLAIGTVEAEANHTSGGTISWAKFGVSDVSAAIPGNQDISPQIPSAAATGAYLFPVTPHGLFEVLPGLNTFYLLADEGVGDWKVWDLQLTLIYFRTAYGTVTPTNYGRLSIPDDQAPEVSPLTPADIAAEQAQAQAFDAARIERELAVMRAELEALKRDVNDQRR